MHRWKCTVGLSCQRFKGWPGNNDNNYDNDDSNDNHGEIQWMIRCELFPCFALNNQQPWCKHASGLDSIIMLISVLLKIHQLERRHTEKVEKERRKSRARDLSSSSRCKKAFEYITCFQLNTLNKSVSPAEAFPIIKATCTKVHKVSDIELPPAPTMIRRRSEMDRSRACQASPTSLTLRRRVRPWSWPLCSAGRFYLIFESCRKLIVHPVARWSPMLGEDHFARSWVWAGYI